MYGQDGEPITVYHKTASPIEALDTAKRGEYSPCGRREIGAFSLRVARKRLQGTRITRCRRTKPARGTLIRINGSKAIPRRPKTTERRIRNTREWVNTGAVAGTVMEVYLSMKNPLVVDMKGAEYQGNGAKYRKAIEQAKAEGHDGVIFKNVYESARGEQYRKKGDVYVVFTPEQVKSVGNVGTFDRTNPNVRYSVNTGADVEEAGNISVAKDKGTGYNDGSKLGEGSKYFKDEQLITEPNTAYFWSGNSNGIGGKDFAREYANKNGGTTLEKLMDEQGITMPNWNVNNPASLQAWRSASSSYARQASGVVHALIGSKVNLNGVWRTIELPELINNPSITKIILVDPDTLTKTTIFMR